MPAGVSGSENHDKGGARKTAQCRELVGIPFNILLKGIPTNSMPRSAECRLGHRVEAFRLERKSLVTDFVIADHRSIVPVSAAARESSLSPTPVCDGPGRIALRGRRDTGLPALSQSHTLLHREPPSAARRRGLRPACIPQAGEPT